MEAEDLQLRRQWRRPKKCLGCFLGTDPILEHVEIIGYIWDYMRFTHTGLMILLYVFFLNMFGATLTLLRAWIVEGLQRFEVHQKWNVEMHFIHHHSHHHQHHHHHHRHRHRHRHRHVILLRLLLLIIIILKIKLMLSPHSTNCSEGVALFYPSWR